MYIYIKDDQVFCMMKVIGGHSIATDNTCRTYQALKDFFANAPKELDTLIDMQAALNPESKVLAQLRTYRTLLDTIMTTSSSGITADDYQASIPPGLHAMVLDSQTDPDNFLKSTNPIFFVAHRRVGDGLTEQHSVLGSTLRAAFADIRKENIRPSGPSVTAYAERARNEPLPTSEEDETILKKLHSIWQALHYPEASWTLAEGALQERIEMIKQVGDLDDNYDIDQISHALDDKAEMLFQENLSSYAASIVANIALDDTTKADKLSVLTQFFLATVNIYLYDKKAYQTNLGAVFDADQHLSSALAEKIKVALSAGNEVEDAIVEFLVERGYIKALSPDEMAAIKAAFSTQYLAIRDSDHMDEFFVKPQDTHSYWFEYGGALSVELCQFANNMHIEAQRDFIQEKIVRFQEIERAADNSIAYAGDPALRLIRQLAASDSPPDTLLFYIIEKNIRDPELVTAVINNIGAAINKKNSEGYTPLHLATQHGRTDIALTLIEKGADVNTANQKGNTPLQLAIKFGSMDIIKALIEKGADVNNIDVQSAAILIITAIKENNIDMVKTLITAGLYEKTIPYWGSTPLIIALRLNYIDIARHILDAKKEVINQPSSYELLYAFHRGEVDNARSIINAKNKLPRFINKSQFPLHEAIGAGHTDIALDMIDNMADVNRFDIDRITPLMMAAKSGNADIINKLLDCGADINKLGGTSQLILSAVTMATISGKPDNAILLIEKGAKIDTPHFNLLEKAIKRQYATLAKKLIDSGADLQTTRNSNHTLVLQAIEYDLPEIAIKMINKGARCDGITFDGKSVLRLLDKITDPDARERVKQCLLDHADRLSFWGNPFTSWGKILLSKISPPATRLIPVTTDENAVSSTTAEQSGRATAIREDTEQPSIAPDSDSRRDLGR